MLRTRPALLIALLALVLSGCAVGQTDPPTLVTTTQVVNSVNDKVVNYVNATPARLLHSVNADTPRQLDGDRGEFVVFPPFDERAPQFAENPSDQRADGCCRMRSRTTGSSAS